MTFRARQIGAISLSVDLDPVIEFGRSHAFVSGDNLRVKLIFLFSLATPTSDFSKCSTGLSALFSSCPILPNF